MILALTLAIWLVIVLTLPKRAWRTIPERLRQAAQGDRRYLFGPPPRLGESLLLRLASEGLRLIEAGLPVYLLALREESRGHVLRLAPEFHPDSCPPAEKARPTRLPQFAMPPMAWRREWEAALLGDRDQPVPLVAEPPLLHTGAAPAPAVLQIRTLGTFQLLGGDHDLAPQLLRYPTLSFIWLFLLSRHATGRDAPVHRQLLADETFPGLDSDQQRARLRRRLSDLPRVLPQALADRIQIDGEYVRFGLEGTDFDVAALQAVVETWGAGTGLLPAEGLNAMETAAAAYGGEYLPIWDELEDQLTRGRGAAGELVRTIRQRTEEAHMRLVLRLAHHHLARRDSPRALPLLEEVLRRRPEREDAAHLLATAYRETGQASRARHVESAPRGVVEERAGASEEPEH